VSTKIGMAMIGTGMAAKPHAMALRDLQDRVEIRGVYSRDASRRRQFAEAWSFPEAESAEALAADPQVDCVLIVTPPNARRETVELFARAGKHILMEKPVERTTEAARGIVEFCEASGVKLGIVFQHRFRETSLALKKLVDGGTLGKLHAVEAAIPWWRDQGYYDEPGRGTYERDGGGVLISQAIHTLDLMLSLAGPVFEVQAIAATTSFHRMEAEDFVAGGLRFTGGAVGSVVASTAIYPGRAESLTFAFEMATVRLLSNSLEIAWHDGRTETRGEVSGTGGGADPMAFPHGWHRELIADFVDAVEEDRPPGITGREALRVHRLIDALLLSSARGRVISLENDA
jgi:predicted dehydrogenase